MELGNTHRIALLEAGNWWYAARRDLLDRLLEGHGPFAHGLDLGCGVGANLPVLVRHCRRLVGLDPEPAAVAHARTRRVSEVVVGDATRLALGSQSVDLAACLDVFEHLDDRAAIAEVWRVLRGGGLLVATVPAHPHLWNENDDFSHHRRRYRRADLRRLLERFEILELGYWNFTSYLPTLGYALWRRRFPTAPRNNLDAVPRLADRALRFAVGLENRWRRWVQPPTGTSLVAVARKPATGGSLG